MTYQVRCSAVTHGRQMVFDESTGRKTRSFYPHQAAPEQFMIQVDLKGYGERTDFIDWMASYGSYVIDPDNSSLDFPSMQVSVPAVEFMQRGVPLTGYEWGDHVGSMLWQLQMVFEAAIDPADPSKPDVSYVKDKWDAFAKDKAIQYFYPFGTQLSGDQAGSYDDVQYPGSPSQFTQSWNANKTPEQPTRVVRNGKTYLPGQG